MRLALGANGAAITRGSAKLISRLYWLGVDRPFLLRAGRTNLPFGGRQVEHTMWVRSSTRTNTNDAWSPTPLATSSSCHANDVRDRGSVTAPSGLAMRARGLIAGDDTSLQNALAKVKIDAVDSVGNGVTDVERLTAGQDPNTGSEVPHGVPVSPGDDYDKLS